MRIRRFRLEDLQAVIELSKKSYEWKREKEIKEHAKNFVNYTLEKYISGPEGLFILEKNGKIIGNCFGHIDEKDKRLGWLWYIAVAPNTQRKGVGEQLLYELTSYFKSKGIKKIRLGTDKPKAVPFYEKHSFKIYYWWFEKEI